MKPRQCIAEGLKSARLFSPALPFATTKRKAALFGLGLLFCLLAELLPYEIIPGSYFSLAMTPALAVAARLGALPGLILMVLGKLISPVHIGTIYGDLVSGLELLVVGLVRRRRPRSSVFLIDSLFWPLLGLPLRALSYHYILGVTPETLLLTLLRVWLVGLFNAYLADFLSDSPQLDRFLLHEPSARDVGGFIKHRVSVLLLPLALVGLFGTVRAFTAREEGELEFRLASALERARGRVESANPSADPAAIVAALNARAVDPVGSFELRAGPGAEAGIRPWGGGYFVQKPSQAPHPVDAWRMTRYFGELELGEARIRFSLPFEPFFKTIAGLYSVALASCLGLIYGIYLLISLAGASLGRRMQLLVETARRLPERVEAGEEPDWPAFDIAELAALSAEFHGVSRRLHASFGELGESRDSLEAAVMVRTADLERRTLEVRLLLERVQREREEERARLARELHDEFGQDLAGLGMALYLLERRLGPAAEAVGEKIAEMRGILAELSEGMRRMVADLRPGALDRLGLAEAISGLCRERSERSGIPIRCSSSLAPGLELPEAIKTAAYRIVQEALSNALKHSGSPEIEIRLEVEEDHLLLRVEDQGRGFEPSPRGRAGRSGFGLLGMEERCRALGGRLELESKPGGGTRIRVALPLLFKERR